ncbi:ANTAR domain-containing protein [Streptomyces sp. SID14478]|uniref:ANTAR domain-containing protein n=1 Tax=Streptomyces sp. SID14478 TaxID=2706073 RepID=UPI0013DC9C97|nr:ANTAR domain-containing protein [Streptomyces sp. SID14478]NEB80006.1 ANTAR domain-containing protein [Streptomyces sp. SID14478]
MVSEGMTRVLVLLETDDWATGVDNALQAGATALQVAGLAVSLNAASTGLESVACSSATARSFDNLQFTLGEGPASDALNGSAEISVTDLARERADRWPLLLQEVARLRVRAVFCFPMTIGAIRIGVLSATRFVAGPLKAQHRDDALALAAALTLWYLNGTEHESDHPDAVSFPPGLQHAVIHQATGMVSAQLAIPLSDALVRLRAHAYGKSLPILDIAHDIVSRQLRLPALDEGTSLPPPDKD